LALGLPVNQMEKQLAFCDVQRHLGVITQSPSVLTCVTPGYPQSFRSRSVNITYRKISTDLYWGTEGRATRYNKYRIAEPEKALLDWIYLSRQERLPTPCDELQLQLLDREKLLRYAERFPRTVRDIAKEILVSESLSAHSSDFHSKSLR
jgi:hypothetical protein